MTWHDVSDHAIETISENKETPSSFTWLSPATSGLEGG